MQTFIEILRPALALIVGAAIGYSFGLIQNAAQRRHQKKEQSGQFTSGWSVMPGSGVRVAYLLITLALIQFVCPILFADTTQWWVSAGVLGGYGWVLFQQIRQRRAAGA
jgi:hypothetical protein